MRPQRYHLRISVGNLLEILGAAASVYGVARLVGLAYGLILLGILLVVAAELIYDDTSLRLPLPRRPHPIRAVRQLPRRFDGWRWDRHLRKLLVEHPLVAESLEHADDV